MAIPPYRQDSRMEPLVDGMIGLLNKNLIANTKLLSDAHAGDTTLHVGNSLRFERGEEILLRDNNSIWKDDTNTRKGLEFHTIGQDIEYSDYLVLKEPVKKDYLVRDNARIQKTLKNTPLYPKDIYYGDREVISWDWVAICVEPEGMTPEWMATNGLLSTEYKMSIFVYVRMGNSADTKNLSMRVCNAYADAIHRLLINNIHLDLTIDEVALLADANAGDNFVYISESLASQWGVDLCTQYEVQDNFKQEWDLAIIPEPSSESFSSSSTSSVSAHWESESSLEISTSSSSSGRSSASTQTFSSSSRSLSSSSTCSKSSETTSSSSESLSSGKTPPGVKIWLNRPLYYHYRVGDKAVLRRKNRYMYDSRVTDIKYGMMQKGEIVKAAQLSWFGKETQVIGFPQVGKGGSAY
jgi:hypothetical protein